MRAIRASRPNLEQQIHATLTSWGLSVDGFATPVDPAAVEKQITLLQSPVSEQRVLAADWLASRGVRSSGARIAAAMDDPATRRPCQLAKSLGSLGDPRWTDKLIDATQQTDNVDLQVCAMLALGELQPPRAVEALIEAYHHDSAPWTALDALGRIADPAALAFLRSVVQSPRNEPDRVLAMRAIQRIRIMRQSDPVPELMDRVRSRSARGGVDAWAVRKLATIQDPRAVPALRAAMLDAGQHDRVLLASALVVHGDTGRIALRRLSEAPAGDDIAAIARAALNVSEPAHR